MNSSHFATVGDDKHSDDTPQNVDSGFLTGELCEFASGEMSDDDQRPPPVGRPHWPRVGSATTDDVDAERQHSSSRRSSNKAQLPSGGQTFKSATHSNLDSGLCDEYEEYDEADVAKQSRNAEIYANSEVMEECMPDYTAPLPLWKVCYTQDELGDTKLHASIRSNETAALTTVIVSIIQLAPHQLLLDLRNDTGKSAMHYAVLTGQPNVIRQLRAAGAQASVRDHRGNTPLHLACVNNNLRCVQALTLPITTDELQLFPYAERIPLLPADTNVLNYDGKNSIHIAVELGHIDVLRQLSHVSGANLNGRETCAGYTALHLACRSRNDDVTDFLLSECVAQLQLETRSYGQQTAYQMAAQLGNAHAVHALRRCGAVQLSPLPVDEDDDEDDEDDFEEDEESNTDDNYDETSSTAAVAAVAAAAAAAAVEAIIADGFDSSYDDNGSVYYYNRNDAV